MKTTIAIYSTDATFRIQFVDRLAQHFPFRSIASMSRLSRSLGGLPVGVRPSLIFVDLSLPKLYSKIYLRKLHNSFPQAELMALIAAEAPEQVFEFIQAGATGYLRKDIWQETLPSLGTESPDFGEDARFLIKKIKCP
jgi:DNA-binding NarL/FixJ family response regulator